MNAKLDARAASAAYSSAFQHLKKLEGFSQKQVLRAEAGSILKQWAGKTKVADPASHGLILSARVRANNVAGTGRAGDVTFGVTINSGRRGGEPGRIWVVRDEASRQWTKKTGKTGFTPQRVGMIRPDLGVEFLNRHLANSQWAETVDRVNVWRDYYKAFYPKLQRASGLARQSVLQIADSLGIDLTQVEGGGVSDAGIAKARAAIASNGKNYVNGSGTESGDDVKYYVTLINRLPYNQRIKMDSTLAMVIQGRAKYIEKSYEKGAFDSIERTRRAFPNLFKAAA
jgi:hypothetical protein